MITCHLMGGLGNQLFQIFTVIAYSIQNGQKFVFPYSKTLGNRNTYWDSFLLTLFSFTSANVKYNFSNGNVPIDTTYKEPNFHYNPIPLVDPSKTLRIYGYFQSYKYFENERDTICNMMRLKAGINSIRLEFSKYLTKQWTNPDTLLDESIEIETISMHFRLGDYVNLPLYHPIMPYEYYESALSNIMSSLNIVTGFSGRNVAAKQDLRSTEVTDTENVATAKVSPRAEGSGELKQIRVLYFCEEPDNEIVLKMIHKLQQKYDEIEFIKVDDTIVDWKQMMIMSCCNHNIIANSSFSWWGAYFNQTIDKIVCYPSKWFGPNLSENNTNDMFPDLWHKIDC
jgi:hypothetical protein